MFTFTSNSLVNSSYTIKESYQFSYPPKKNSEFNIDIINENNIFLNINMSGGDDLFPLFGF